ncbi:RNA-guided endonuclease InsQ/TnpB family protein [Conchiformibius kuhniae]|uniref:RNA-guided endonuclease InsQ/TnpB family protein n=1 Tax=Conchiformibius kuhniae TaxID=211502 RepID=A0A8T9MWH0_9NEIS|nr:transposase [Conchiformibius kuhniae]
MPSDEQICKMKRFCGCARFVFNRGLMYQLEQYQQDASFKFSYAELSALLPAWKREWHWLKECHSQVLQQSLKDLACAFKNFFSQRACFPKFKRKGKKDSFRFPQACKLEQHNNRIYLPKIGWVRYRNSRLVSGSLKNVTVSQKCGQWFVSVQTECETAIPKAKGGAVGVDAIVFVEDLQVANMSQSTKGNAERHGKNVSAKSGLNRAILDQAWSEFRRQLGYKLLWRGGRLIAVPPQNTSRCCPVCGHTAKENRPTQARFACMKCAFAGNADVVGAMNVLKRGQAALAAHR